MSDLKRKITIFIDEMIGEPIFNILTLFYKNEPHNIDKEQIKKILIIRPGGIGDYLLNIPSFKAVRKLFPQAKIDIFLFKRSFPSLSFYDDFDKKTIIDKPVNLLKFILSNKDYDLTIDFDQHRKIPSILTILSKSKIRIGFHNKGKEKAYNYSFPYKEGVYEAENFVNLLKPIGFNRRLKEEDLMLIKNHKRDKKSIGIYAAAMKIKNRLPIHKWKEIIEKIGKDKTFYFIGSKEDKERYDELESQLSGFKIERSDGKLSLKESLELVSKLSILYSEDGGVYHMAVCTGTPTVSYWLHGEKNMMTWKGPFGKHEGILLK